MHDKNFYFFSGREAFCYHTNLFMYGDDVTIGLLIRKIINNGIILVIRQLIFEDKISHRLTELQKYLSLFFCYLRNLFIAMYDHFWPQSCQWLCNNPTS